jgi:flagellar basal-body rod modification protein FlgD
MLIEPTSSVQPMQSGGTTKTSGDLSSDFDTFLSLLTAQIRNQDPTNPADGTEFVAQLATFSNVEQSIRGNELLESVVMRLDRSDLSAAANLIGRTVRHDGPVGAGVQELSVEIPAIADRAEIVVTGPDGGEVRRLPVDPSSSRIAWPPAGETLSRGPHTLRVEAMAGEQPLDPVPVTHEVAVREVTIGAGGTQLVLGDGVRLPAERVLAIR